MTPCSITYSSVTYMPPMNHVEVCMDFDWHKQLCGIQTTRHDLGTDLPIINEVIAIDEDMVQDILSAIEKLNISPKSIGDIGGCDGATYTLSICGKVDSLTLEWWSCMPEEWSALSDIADMFEAIHPLVEDGR